MARRGAAVKRTVSLPFAVNLSLYANFRLTGRATHQVRHLRAGTPRGCGHPQQEVRGLQAEGREPGARDRAQEAVVRRVR